MASVKSIMNCIGVDTSEGVSVLGHLFGFSQKRVPADACSPTPSSSQVSLLDHVKSLKGKHVHLNIIRVGIDNFTSADINGIDYAIYQTRRIYRTVNLGVGRVEYHDINSADANGHNNLASFSEADDLINEQTIPNDGLDVFMVLSISDSSLSNAVGYTPNKGPCSNNSPSKYVNGDGLIGGEVGRPANEVARTLAHEIGHYLGLDHNHPDGACPTTTDECNNIMAQTICANSCGSGVCQAVNLTDNQGNIVRGHCYVQAGC